MKEVDDQLDSSVNPGDIHRLIDRKLELTLHSLRMQLVPPRQQVVLKVRLIRRRVLDSS